jgi:NADH-quinone oxidoreductase subunit C
MDALRARLPGMETRPPETAPTASVDPGALREHLLHLRDRLGFDHLAFMTGLDKPAESRVELIYRLFSWGTGLSLTLRTSVPRDSARVASVSDIYRTADWHERETAEMFGVEFSGHPDPRKLLLPDDIEGHPLRKDFSHPNMIRLPEVET